MNRSDPSRRTSIPTPVVVSRIPADVRHLHVEASINSSDRLNALDAREIQTLMAT